ncbi:MAG: hypothetical protein ACI9G1_002391 [Pirellulaceae bacterium]|jgi:hypothetical protein
MKKMLGAIAVLALVGFVSPADAQTSLYQSCEPNYGAAATTARPPFQTLEAYRVGTPSPYNQPQQQPPVVVARPAAQPGVHYAPGSCCSNRGIAPTGNGSIGAATFGNGVQQPYYGSNPNGVIPGGGTADIAPSLRAPVQYQSQLYGVPPVQYQSQLYRAPPTGYYQQQQRTNYAPRGAQLSKGIYGQPTVYVPGQPVRNFWRYWTP